MFYISEFYNRCIFQFCWNWNCFVCLWIMIFFRLLLNLLSGEFPQHLCCLSCCCSGLVVLSEPHHHESTRPSVEAGPVCTAVLDGGSPLQLYSHKHFENSKVDVQGSVLVFFPCQKSFSAPVGVAHHLHSHSPICDRSKVNSSTTGRPRIPEKKFAMELTPWVIGFELGAWFSRENVRKVTLCFMHSALHILYLRYVCDCSKALTFSFPPGHEWRGPGSFQLHISDGSPIEENCFRHCCWMHKGSPKSGPLQKGKCCISVTAV